MVKSYPKCVLVLSALGGFLIGRNHGEALLNRAIGGFTDVVSERLNRSIDDALGL